MSSGPAAMVMCALLLCVPVQPEGAPPCPASPSPHTADPTGRENPGEPGPCPSPSPAPSATSSATSSAIPSATSSGSPFASPEPSRNAPQRVTDVSSADGDPVVIHQAAPVSTASRVVGHVSTGILAVLCVVVLVMRLSVGWPRFPVPYSGQRRRGTGGGNP